MKKDSYIPKILIGLIILFSIYFIIMHIPNKQKETKKIKEGFIPKHVYMPHVKKIHENFRLYTTQQVNKVSQDMLGFLRNWYIIY